MPIPISPASSPCHSERARSSLRVALASSSAVYCAAVSGPLPPSFSTTLGHLWFLSLVKYLDV